MSAYAGNISPQQAWDLLRDEPKSALVDVRTPAEWNYVGLPDLSSLGKKPVLVPWQVYPTMDVNAQFADFVTQADVVRDAPVMFLCRSGVRSRAAAIAMTRLGFSRCYNIVGGFEGDPDPSRHRGIVNGWKVAGLPWAQG